MKNKNNKIEDFNLRAVIGNLCNEKISQVLDIRIKNDICDPIWLDEQVEWMFLLLEGCVYKNKLREHLVNYILKEYGIIAFGVESNIKNKQ